MKESNILYQIGDFWAGRGRGAITVYRSGPVASVPDSSYPDDPDGESLAIARCNYLAKVKPVIGRHPDAVS